MEKEIAIFVRDQKEHAGRVKARSQETIVGLFELGWRDMFLKFEKKLAQLAPLFAQYSIVVEAPQGHQNFQEALDSFAHQRWLHVSQFLLVASMRGYSGQASEPFDVRVELRLDIKDFEYHVVSQNYGLFLRKRYSEPILADEADRITTDLLKSVFEDIKRRGQSSG